MVLRLNPVAEQTIGSATNFCLCQAWQLQADGKSAMCVVYIIYVVLHPTFLSLSPPTVESAASNLRDVREKLPSHIV